MDYFLFVVSFACASLLPGLCMNLAFSLGLHYGYKNTLWMMFGEVFGLGVVVLCCVMGLSVILKYDFVFKSFKILGAFYLLYVSYHLFKAKLTIQENKIYKTQKFSLLLQGFLASLLNPKTWIFILSLLPSFLNKSTNLALLAFIILFIEFCALNLYALGGSLFKKFMNKHIGKLNKISAFLIAILAFFMIFD